MYPEDRVLIAYVPSLEDFEIIRQEGWYRIPQRYAPKGIHAEFFAFYFGREFGDQKWAIHYFAEQRGNELVNRVHLFPDQADHPRAEDLYYKVSLGQLIKLKQPIVSLRWRRVTFMHTTWDRFIEAREINDLFIEGDPFVDRLFSALRDKGLRVERNYSLKEEGSDYSVPLAITYRGKRIDIHEADIPANDQEIDQLIKRILEQLGTHQ